MTTIEPGALTAEGARTWRRAMRAELLAARAALPPDQQAKASARALKRLRARLKGWAGGTVGLYWPFRGEIDPWAVFTLVEEEGGATALPVVVGRDLPLAFRLWKPGDATEAEPSGLQHPSEGRGVEPDVLVIPVVGFDESCYRLGYGGGYYDRTLAGARKRPLAIGLGFHLARLPSIQPQTHDVPLDCVVTEAGITERQPQPR